MLLIDLLGLHLLDDAHVGVLELAVLEDRSLALLLLHEIVVQHQGLAGEAASQLQGTADGELETVERVSLVETLAVGLEECAAHLSTGLDVLQLEGQLTVKGGI